MSEAMRGATKAMGSMNRQMNLPKIQQIMMEFEKESELMDMKDEMMGDAIDDAMEEEDDEEESDEIVSKVLDEIGININQEVRLTQYTQKTSLLMIFPNSLPRYQQVLSRQRFLKTRLQKEWLKQKVHYHQMMLLCRLDWIT
jgi:division protein CdvB (Snf7/Vps24/ESCRT-III family)